MGESRNSQKGHREEHHESPSDQLTFFATPAEFRGWLISNHAKRTELTIGFGKVGSGKPSLTWPQAIEEAIAFGWIDGVRHSIDAVSYSVRFTRRKPYGTWSAVNVATANRLIAQGRMAPSGLSAFETRKDSRTAIYAYEQRTTPRFAPAEEAEITSDSKAWKYFASRPSSYKKAATWWVISAKTEETRARRLAQLIAYSKKGRPVPPLTPRIGKG